MATSGNTIWSQSREELVKAALRKLGILPEGAEPTTQQRQDGIYALNNLIVEYRALGMALWKRYDLNIDLVVGQQNYEIGSGKSIDTPYPLHILQARLLTSPTSTYINLNILPDYRFNQLPITSTGVPVSVSYVPRIDVGYLSVWPIPNSAVPTGTQIILTYIAPTEVFTYDATPTPDESLDFPAEWYNAVIYGLALLLADEYQLPIQDKQWIEKQSERHLATALSNGTEDGSFFISPDSRRQ